MAKLTTLLARLPDHRREVRMSTYGHVLWVCWHGVVPPAVTQTLQNYGGMQVVSDHEQALWFFFTDDVFLALARLTVWSNFNSLPVTIELIPGRLVLDNKREILVNVAAALQAQEMVVSEKFEVWIHPKSREGKSVLPGISFAKAHKRQGMTQVEWAHMEVDVRMPYTSTQSWYAILHPLGSPLDKEYQAGWSAMLKCVEGLLQQHKMKFIVQDAYVMIYVENLSVLRTFIKDYLRTFDKESDSPNKGPYWPCVCVVADRKNYNFNAELPRKIGLQWDKLMPDFPYMSYRNAYLLGSGVTVRDISFAGEHASMDSWCTVLLSDNKMNINSIPLLMSSALAATTTPVGCFYCGLHNHTASECPTRSAPSENSNEIWDRLSLISLENLNAGFRDIETALAAKGVDGMKAILDKGGDSAALLRAVLALNGPSQLRNVPRQWLYRMRDSDNFNDDTPARDDSPAWDLLDDFVSLPPEKLSEFEKNLSQTIARHQRDPRLRTVMGFLQVEKGNFDGASLSFREAASMTAAPALQAWNEYLMGRLLEEQGQLPKALEQYRQVLKIMPQWQDVRYREIVCKVKMGFTEQMLDQILDLVRKDPSYFNKVLIDPALERGRLLILSALFEPWEAARLQADEEHVELNALIDKLDAWFPEDHPVQIQLGKRFRHTQQCTSVQNYMAFLRIREERPLLEKELTESIHREVEGLRDRYRTYLELLQDVRDEASWFPFPQALKEFSGEFNECAGIINWAFACNFNDAGTFQRAEAATPKVNDLLRSLRKRLKMLRVVRDVTLFCLTSIKTFAWMEILGLLLCFIAVPLIILLGDQLNLGWLRNMIGESQWEIIKVMIMIVTILSIGVSLLISTITFEGKREKLLAEARAQRERAQQMRLERVKQQRRIRDENARKAAEAEAHRRLLEQMRGGPSPSAND